MPFQYTPYQSPYVGSIAELIGKRGDIAAQQAQNKANLIGNITNAVTRSIGDIAQYQREKPARELAALQLQNAQQQMADTQESRAAGNELAQLMSGKTPNVVNTIGGVKQLNPDAIQQAMTQAGHGRWMLDHGDKVAAFNQSQQQLSDLKQKVITNAVSIFASTPDALQLDAAKTLLDAFHGTGTLPTDVEAKLVDQLQVGDLSGIKALAQPYMPKPQITELKSGSTYGYFDRNNKFVQTAVGTPESKPVEGLYDVPGVGSNIKLEKRGEQLFRVGGTTPLTPEQIQGMTGARPEGGFEAQMNEIGAKIRSGAPVSPEDKAKYDEYIAAQQRRDDASLARAMAVVKGREDAQRVQAGRRNLQKITEEFNNVNKMAQQAINAIDSVTTSNNTVDAHLIPSLIASITNIRRIPRAEIQAVAGAGSAYDRLAGFIDNYVSGKPFDARVLKDARAVATAIQANAYDAYERARKDAIGTYDLPTDVYKIPNPNVPAGANVGDADFVFDPNSQTLTNTRGQNRFGTPTIRIKK